MSRLVYSFCRFEKRCCNTRNPAGNPLSGRRIWAVKAAPTARLAIWKRSPITHFKVTAATATAPRSRSRPQGVPHRLFVDLQDLRGLPARRACVLHAPGHLHLVLAEGPATSRVAPCSCPQPLLGAPACHLPLPLRHPRRHADHLGLESEVIVGLQLRKLCPPFGFVHRLDLHPQPTGS